MSGCVYRLMSFGVKSHCLTHGKRIVYKGCCIDGMAERIEELEKAWIHLASIISVLDSDDLDSIKKKYNELVKEATAGPTDK